ncbi:diphthine synthase [Candidatus Woesearchaeota archaeon]|nr:MAG: diphthine synthase [Candidatus Woesearchaeota archaeon]
MLYLIGLGLFDSKDVSLRGLEAIKSCSKVYLEGYTSRLSCPVEDLKKLYGLPVEVVGREFVESADELLKRAGKEDVALLIIGDPLCATTHWDILTRARELGIDTRVVHNASVMSAIGATGLQVYKFGKTTSIPFPQEGFEPENFYDILAQNKSIGAHTLMLLDLDPKSDKFMSVNEAIELVRKVERKHNKGIFLPEDLCIGVARLGWESQKIVSGTVLEVSDADFGPPPQALIVPGNLHFVEEDAINSWRA